MSHQIDPVHALRYETTLAYLRKLNTKKLTVLDVGGESWFTDQLRKVCKFVECTGTRELRFPFTLGQQFDLIVCTEVIEHIHDIYVSDVNARAQWMYSGQLAVLANLRALLKPEGRLFLTTPNAVSLRVIWNAIHELLPVTYEPHVRELTQRQLHSLLEKTDYEIIDSGIWNVWKHHGCPEVQKIKDIVKSFGQDAERGDDLFVLAKRKYTDASVGTLEG